MSWESLLKPGRYRQVWTQGGQWTPCPCWCSGAVLGWDLGTALNHWNIWVRSLPGKKAENKLFYFIVLFSKDEIWAGKGLQWEVLLSALKEIEFDSAAPWTSGNHMLTVLRTLTDLNIPLFSPCLPIQTCVTREKRSPEKSSSSIRTPAHLMNLLPVFPLWKTLILCDLEQKLHSLKFISNTWKILVEFPFSWVALCKSPNPSVSSQDFSHLLATFPYRNPKRVGLKYQTQLVPLSYEC